MTTYIYMTRQIRTDIGDLDLFQNRNCLLETVTWGNDLVPNIFFSEAELKLVLVKTKSRPDSGGRHRRKDTGVLSVALSHVLEAPNQQLH